MKAIQRYITIVVVLVCLLTGCEKGLDDINVNRVNPTTLDAPLLMNQAIIDANFRNGEATLGILTYEFGIVQQIITPYGSSLAGANYNQNNTANSGRTWTNYYQNVVKQVVDVVSKTKENPDQMNLYQSARIWKAYAFMILTDTYGDVPYFEAGQGFLGGITQPKYDAQELIYKDILKELEEASAALDASKPTAPTEVLYGGNVVKWKRLGYSLMLRAAMRLVKVDPALAQSYVTKAVAGGLMQSNADNAVVRHTALYNNWISFHLSAREKTNFYLAAPFVNYLQSNNDPRLGAFAVRYVGAKGGTEQLPARASFDPAVQKGMPVGYDDVSVRTTLVENGVASLWDYSQGNLNTILNVNAPDYHVTYSQTQLLLAEAVTRGWATGDASALYSAGITAHMQQVAEYGAQAVIADAQIQTYVAAHPLSATNPLGQINTQYWVSSFLNGPEAFANFRRTGYPELAPNPYPASETPGGFIRRLAYPDSEIIVNQGNVAAAIARQGPNDLKTRVWWDKL
jgi:hypothetical protein